MIINIDYICIMKMKIVLLVLFTILATLFFSELAAQCPMCKMAAESNLENGGTAGKGLNKGILYILSMPYLLVAALGIIWYRNRIDQTKLEEEA